MADAGFTDGEGEGEFKINLINKKIDNDRQRTI